MDIFDILTYDNQVAENITITTDYPDWTQINYFTSPVREAGKYKIGMSVIWKLGTVTKSGLLRYSLDGGSTWKEFQSEPKDKTNDNANVFAQTVDHAGGAFDIRIDMTREAGTASMDCSFSEITIDRKG
jgi:hypothetical protein